MKNKILLTSSIVLATILFTGCETSSTSANNVSLSANEAYILEYVYNKEKVAQDLYRDFYYLSDEYIFSDIAEHSAAMQMSRIRTTLQIYDRYPYELDYLEVGEFTTLDAEDLYINMYNKGTQTLFDSYQAGCIISTEIVLDIDYYSNQLENYDLYDLLGDIREDSMQNYIAFDNKLQDMGVYNGCCSAGNQYCLAY